MKQVKRKRTRQLIGGLLLTFLMFPLALNAQDSFWFGNPIADFLDPNTADAYHDFLADTVIPAIQPGAGGSNNPENDTGVTIYEPDRCWNGYTLLCSMGGHQSDPNGPVCSPILIDMEGNLVKEWALGTFAVPMKMLPGGYVMGAIPGKGILAQLDWDGNVVWNSGLSYHHDYQREGNPVGYYAPGMEARVDGGKTLVLSNALPDPNLTTHISDFPLLDEVISEHDWQANVLWRWNAWEHFEQMGFDDAAKDAIRTKFVRFMNPNATDYLHFNCASWLGPNKWYDQGDLRFHPDNIIFDGRSINVIAIIARHDHPQGQWVSGDIVWRVGPDYSADHPENKLGQIIGQHMAHMIPRGLPGEGNILLFDNGGSAGFGALVPGSSRGSYPNTLRDFSRVIEFDPVTLDLVWEWKQPSPTADCDGDGDIKCEERKFFSVFISGAQRLENGNTMICEGATGRIFEVTSDGDIVWEYISPYTGAANSPFKQKSVYRAYRVPASWLPEGAVQ
jgi:hypothetical protein